MQNDILHNSLVALTIGIRILAAWGAYWSVIRRMMNERRDIPVELKGYNLKLILSVFGFVITCIGTSFFQACRSSWLPGCSTDLVLDQVALFNSIGLFAAYYVMHLLVNNRLKIPMEGNNKNIRQIKKDTKEIKKDVKEVKEEVSR